MPKRTSNSSVNSSIRQQTKSNEEGLGQLLATQQQAVEQLGSIRQLLELSKEKERQEKSPASGESSGKTQSEIVETLKQQLRGSRRYWKLQEDFQKEWDKEAKDIAEMAKGMKTFKTMGEKWADKKEGLKEKFGIANGGMKQTVLKALNVGGIFNKTIEKDKFIAQQKALGAAPMAGESAKDFKKRLSADFEGANKAAKETKKTEAAIAKHKATAGIDDEEHLKRVSPEFAKLIEKRQSNADEFGKYQRAVDKASPTPVTRLDSAAGMNIFGKKAESSPTETAAEHAQDAETVSETKKMTEEELHLLKKIVDNTGGANKPKEVKPEEKKPEGGGLLDSIFSMLSSGLMNAFKALLNPGAILKALGRVFAIGMIVGALFEGIMDGFDEFMKTGDIGKALIAGLAGIIDFLTFGLFDKEKIKEVIGDFSKWIGDHLIKPFTDFIGGIKDSFLSLIENIGLPKMGFTIPVINKEVSIGPFYPFKKDAKTQAAPEPATQPQSGNVVDQKSANNENAKQEKPVENKTAVVNAPVTTNNTTTQVIKSPIRNQESSSSRYLSNRYA